MTFKERWVIREHMKWEHSVDKFFCIIDNCGVKQKTEAGKKPHYKEAHDHGAGERQAREEPEELEGPREHHNRVQQGIDYGATGRRGQNPPRAGQTGHRGTKRPEKGCETPPNTEGRKASKDNRRHDGTAGKQGVKRKDPRSQNKPVQHQGQEEFRKRFHDALNDLKTKGRVVRYDKVSKERKVSRHNPTIQY